jgi:hypothetical protein
MILGPMIAAAMAGALALPVAGTGRADTPPPAAPASTNPLVALAGDGFAAIGDIFHAVPILGPLATGVAEHAFCAAEYIPVAGAVAKASVKKFDNDQNQGGVCSQGMSSSTSPSATSGSSDTASTGGSSATGTGGATTGTAKPSSGSDSGAATSADHSAASDHTSTADHASASDHPAAANHPAAADHPAAPDHAAAGHGAAAASGKHAAQVIAFPSGRFQLRQPGGNCLVKGGGATAEPGTCDAASAWVYQTDTGELHPATDSATCLLAPTKNLEMISIASCASAASWAKHWYLSNNYRLYVRDTSDNGTWRFLGAPGALVVGGADERSISAIPSWTLPAA